MSTVLDTPTVADLEALVLDDTDLSEVLTCLNCQSGATWRWEMRCCGDHAELCDVHDKKGRESVDKSLAGLGRHLCRACRHVFGFSGLSFSDIYRRRPI